MVGHKQRRKFERILFDAVIVWNTTIVPLGISSDANGNRGECLLHRSFNLSDTKNVRKTIASQRNTILPYLTSFKL